jgi:hypothetical protein
MINEFIELINPSIIRVMIIIFEKPYYYIIKTNKNTSIIEMTALKNLIILSHKLVFINYTIIILKIKVYIFFFFKFKMFIIFDHYSSIKILIAIVLI